MLATLLEATGRSVGLATSPHLERVHERSCGTASRSTTPTLARVLTQIEVTEEFLTELPSYFEIMVAAAFTFFADVAVHVGGGRGGHGRHVGRDERRGRRRRGRHERGPRSPGVPRDDPRRDRAATRRGSSVRTPRSCSARPIPSSSRSSRRAARARIVVARPRLRRACATASPTAVTSWTSYTPGAEYPEVFVPLHGAHQVDNAALALAAAEAHIGTPLADESVHEGFARVTSPGRLEVMGTQPLILLDGAHNVAGATRARPSAARRVRAPAAHPRRRPPPREGSGRDARRARGGGRRAPRVHPAADAACARPPRRGRRGDGARCRRRAHRRVRRRRRRGARELARSPRPTARSWSPARSTWSARPGPPCTEPRVRGPA